MPIVMWGSGYPVEAGLANSLARPGKNVTGVTSYSGTGIWGKLLQLLRDSNPSVNRVAAAWGYVPPAFPREEIEPSYRDLREAAANMRLTLHIEEIPSPERVAAGLSAIESARPDAVLITAGPGFYTERQRVLRFAISKRLPTVADWPWPPGDDAHPLLVLAPMFEEQVRVAAAYVVRILEKGERAGDLPFHQPSRFVMSINRRTARAIGWNVPQALHLRADQLID
jgi:putative ABC transport system substrate-binding protein